MGPPAAYTAHCTLFTDSDQINKSPSSLDSRCAIVAIAALAAAAAASPSSSTYPGALSDLEKQMMQMQMSSLLT